MVTVGDVDYRAFVGPPEEYDIMGATQFSLLCALGLRERHRLLDIGCGSLRGGRLFISYLAPGCYTGLEPSRWLVEEAIGRQLGHDVLALKAPTFIHNDSFDVAELDPFDFVVAQSIASHTGPTMTRSLFEAVRGALTPRGLAAVTFVHGYRDSTDEGWVYPECVRYRRRTIEAWLDAAGLQGSPLAWYHPRQTWWAITQHGTPAPPRVLRLQARGAMLSFRASWDMRFRMRLTLREAKDKYSMRVGKA
jgi:SAM-dependent methyltransferase